MSRKIITGIDLGTGDIKVVVSELHSPTKTPHIIGIGRASAKGLRHGYIEDSNEVLHSIQKAIECAQKESGITIRDAYISVGGIGIEEHRAKAHSLLSVASTEISEEALDSVIKKAENSIQDSIINKKIVHAIPIAYKLDGKELLSSIVGMRGSRLEVETLFLVAPEQHISEAIDVVENAGVEVLDVMTTPLASSFITLSKAQKVAGCILVNIGAETTSIVVFEENAPISAKVFPIGSIDITHDIALGLKVSLEEAEQIKKGAITNSPYSEDKVEALITKRLKTIFTLIDGHLKTLGKSALLPAGVILTGGGAHIRNIEDIARNALKLPASIAPNRFGENILKDSTWTVASGLCIFGTAGSVAPPRNASNSKGLITNIWNWLKQFLP